MSTSPETPQSELQHAAKLDNKHRGELAELAFMRKATSRGLSIAKPWSDGERYDVIVRAGSVCWRVQVKSVLAKSPCRDHYRIKTSGGTGRNRHTPYSASEIDFWSPTFSPRTSGTFFPPASSQAKPPSASGPDRKSPASSNIAKPGT